MCGIMHTLIIVCRSVRYMSGDDMFFSFSLGAFTKLREATVSFVISVCLSVRMNKLSCHWTDFLKFDM